MYYYENDTRLLSMAEIERILTRKYGNDEYDRNAGCYKNDRWFSINKILEYLSKGE